MSVSGLSSSNFYGGQNVQNNFQQFKQDFQQLGQALQSGNLSAAQADFATLQQLQPQNNTATAATGTTAAGTTAQNNNPVAQEFSQLSQDLQSGNLSAAQQAFATIQQDTQNQATQRQGGHHYRQGGGGSEANGIEQELNQLGQALQSGNLSTAQQAYSTLQEDFQQFGQAAGAAGTSSTSQGDSTTANNVSLSV